MSGGHEVVVPALRDYAGRLEGDVAVPQEVSDLVERSDVGNRSWGVVGLFVHGEYTGMLGEVKDALVEMGTGLRSASEKLTKAADAYDQHEQNSQQLLGRILRILEDPSTASVPRMGPSPQGS